MAELREGGCLCGAVRYRVVGEPLAAGVCHCNFCKRGTGSAFRAGAYFDDAAITITSGVLKAYEYRSDESKRWIKKSHLWDHGYMDCGMVSGHACNFGGNSRRSELA
jgi:hypothetical protein